jgi:hypothetical protein
MYFKDTHVYREFNRKMYITILLEIARKMEQRENDGCHVNDSCCSCRVLLLVHVVLHTKMEVMLENTLLCSQI